jgi:hypothetical protein
MSAGNKRGRPWPKGVSGNPKGRPSRPEKLDVASYLAEPIEVEIEGVVCEKSVFEIHLRRLISSALKGNLHAIAEVLKHADRAGMLEAVQDSRGGSVLFIPKEWDPESWRETYLEKGPPPWPGKHNGLIPAERQGPGGRR